MASVTPASVGPRPEGVDVPPILRQAIYYTLRIGVAGAVLLLLAGLVVLLAEPSSGFVAALTHGTPFSIRTLWTGSASSRGVGLLLAGFLILVLTPLVRVVISAIAFGTVRDRAFTTLTLVVLVLLGISMLLGAYP